MPTNPSAPVTDPNAAAFARGGPGSMLSTNASGATTFTPAMGPTSGAISADQLMNRNPQNPLSIPQTTPVTFSAPSVPQPTGTTPGSNGQVSPTPSNDTNASIKSTIQNLIGEEGTEGDVTNSLNQQNGVDRKTAQATSDYNAYIQAKQDLANRLENIQENNPTGATALGKSEEYAAAEREGNADLANLAVQAQMSQGLLTAAQKTVSDKIADQFQPIKDQISALTTFNSVNNADLTESEKTQITANAEQLKTESAAVQTAVSDIHQTLLKDGAPASAYSAVDAITAQYTSGKIDAATAQSEMYAAASQYGASTGTLSKVETAKGISNAAVDSKTFDSLPSDVQDFFAKSSAATIGNWVKAKDAVAGGTDPSKAAADNSLNLSSNALAYLKTFAPAPGTQTNSGGFLGWLKGLFGGNQQSTTTQSTAKGATTTINGHSYTSDGTQWVLSE